MLADRGHAKHMWLRVTWEHFCELRVVRLELLAASIPDGKEVVGEGVREGDEPGAPSDWDAYDVSLV